LDGSIDIRAAIATAMSIDRRLLQRGRLLSTDGVAAYEVHRPGIVRRGRTASRQHPLVCASDHRCPDSANCQAVWRTGAAVDAFGVGQVRAQVAARRWQRPVRGVIVTHNGPLTPEQRREAALSRSAPGAVLGGLTALEVDGFTGFDEDRVQVVLPMGSRRPAESWISPHWSSMLADVDVHPTRQPRRTRTARSVVDAASWQAAPQRARAIVLAGVQQQLVNTRALRQALSRRGPCRHRALIIQSILDAAGGIQSLPERDIDQIRRRCGLPAPTRQAPVRRPDRRYYLDIAWLEYGVAVEVHGIPHLGVRQWEQDLARANEIVIQGPRLLVFSSYAIRHEPARVGDQLVRLLRRGGWAG